MPIDMTISDTTDYLTYEKKILIRSEQVDMTRKLRISELFRLMEEASIAHTELLGCTREKTLDRGLLWVITRQQAEIEELPAYDEEITVRSWQGEMMHVFFPRFYEIERAGKVIIRGQALWVLIDEEERQMIMPEDYDIEIPGRPGSDDMMLPAVVMPKGCTEASSAAGGSQGAGQIMQEDLITRFSQVDINGHMNNTRYFDIIDDAVCEGAIGVMKDEAGSTYDLTAKVRDAAAWKKTPRLISANYLSELKAGDRFALTGYRDENGSVYYEGADGNRVKFRIKYEY